jgi:hypothetical protein
MVLNEIGFMTEEAYHYRQPVQPIIWSEESLLFLDMYFLSVPYFFNFKLHLSPQQIADLSFDANSLKASTSYEIEERLRTLEQFNRIADDMTDDDGNPGFEMIESVETILAFRDQPILDDFRDRCSKAGISVSFVVRPIE